MTHRLLGFTASLAFALIAAHAGAASAAVRLHPIGAFDEPVYVTAPAGDTRRVFVVERHGTIRVLVDGMVQPRPFLDIRRRVSQPPDASDERGLLSMAFAPDYATSGRFYVYYTRTRRGKDVNDVVVDEYRSGSAEALTVRRTSRRQVLAIATGRQHFGGQLAFGPDGYLWLGPGDGRGPGDPGHHGQNARSLRGKLLRIDPRPHTGLIAHGNPWPRGTGTPLAWASGLRNPFRFSFDRLTGDLVIGDVGQNLVEEINVAPRVRGLGRRANYGWARLEGRFLFNPATPFRRLPAAKRQLPRNYVAPAIEHLHTRGWCAITGGYVVRDPNLPQLEGRYVYGDFCKGEINQATLHPDGRATGVRSTGLTVTQLSSFGEDGCGRVYVTSLKGPVYRLAESGTCAGPAPTPYPVPAAEAAAAVAEPGAEQPAASADVGFAVFVARLRCALRPDDCSEDPETGV